MSDRRRESIEIENKNDGTTGVSIRTIIEAEAVAIIEAEDVTLIEAEAASGTKQGGSVRADEPLPMERTTTSDTTILDDISILPPVTEQIQQDYVWEQQQQQAKQQNTTATANADDEEGAVDQHWCFTYTFGIGCGGIPVLMWCLCLSLAIGILVYTIFSYQTYDDHPVLTPTQGGGVSEAPVQSPV